MKKKTYNTLAVVLVIFLSILMLSVVAPSNNKPLEPKQPNNKDAIKEEPVIRRASVVMVGDALIHDAVYKDASKGNNQYDFSHMLTYIQPIIQEYDLRYYNQETVIGGKNLGLSSYPRFNSPDEIGEDLVAVGFNLVGLANNHTLDKNEKGVRYSVDFWKKQEGVYTAGSYASWEDRNQITIFQKNDITFAFLAYTTGTNGLKAPQGKEYLVNVYSDETAKKDIELAKEEAEVIIVAMHWGTEYNHNPSAKQKEIAKYLSGLGANLIIGTHPHVVQPIDYVGDTLVVYSLGNFIAAQKTLGLNKEIGLMAGIEIVVDEGSKVTFENLDYKLLYIYHNAKYRDYKIIPFENLTTGQLKNYKVIEEQYKKLVDKKVGI